MLNEKIDSMIANAIKANNHIEATVYRSIKAAFINYKVAKAGNVLDDAMEIKIISKLIAQHNDSIAMYTNANRLDLADVEIKENEILKSLLPAEASDNDIEIIVKSYIDNVGEVSMKDMKNVMNVVKSKYPTANGGTISAIFKRIANL